MDTFYFVFYLIELTLKVVAHGFFMNEGAYLSDGWNVLDFFIILTAIINKIISDYGFNLKALRSLRVLRPLKVIASLKQLQTILESLFLAMPLLADSFLILIFCYLLFALAGLQLFPGLLKKRCIFQRTGLLASSDALCGNANCSSGQICSKLINNPNYGLMNFDNIFYSFLNVFQIVTLDNWTSIMYSVQKTFTNYVSIYFLLLVIIGGLFLVNLTLAIIKVKFSGLNSKSSKPMKSLIKVQKIYDFLQLKEMNMWNSREMRKSSKTLIIHALPSISKTKDKSVKIFDKFDQHLICPAKISKKPNPFSMKLLSHIKLELGKITNGITSYASEIGKATMHLGKTVGMNRLIKAMDKISPLRLLKKSQGNVLEELDKKTRKIENLNPKYLKLQIKFQKEYVNNSQNDILHKDLFKKKAFILVSSMYRNRHQTKRKRVLKKRILNKAGNSSIYRIPKSVEKEKKVVSCMKIALKNTFFVMPKTFKNEIDKTLYKLNNMTISPKNLKTRAQRAKMKAKRIEIGNKRIKYEEFRKLWEEDLEENEERRVLQEELFNNVELYDRIKVINYFCFYFNFFLFYLIFYFIHYFFFSHN